jgi:hypothetical protein
LHGEVIGPSGRVWEESEEFKEFEEYKEFKERSQEPESRSQENRRREPTCGRNGVC